MELESILRIIFPLRLFDCFELDKMEEGTDQIPVYLSEKKVFPVEMKGSVQSYGFTPYSSVQDFPIKGKTVYLHILRRKWLDVNTREIIICKFEIAHDVTRLTKEFVAFLKETNRK
jgi:hypothetical protein